MVASIGALTSAAQGVSYYERDGYYAKDDAEHRAASAWLGTGAAEAGLEGNVDPEAFRAVLEGVVPDGSGRRLGRIGKDGERQHRPGRDLTLSAPKSVSLAALVGGDARVVDAHDRAVARTIGWFEKNVAETRTKDPETGRMVRTGGQKTVVAAFRHDSSRNLDPALHTHAVIANMVKGPDGKGDGKWRSMSNEKLYASKMVLGRDLPERARGGPVAARLSPGQDPCRRALRDRGRLAQRGRGVLDAARRDPGGDGGAQPREPGGQSPPCRARDADDPLRETGHRPGRAHGHLAEAGCRSRVRCEGAGGRSRTRGGWIEGRHTGRTRSRIGAGAGRGAGSVTGGNRGTGGVGGWWRGPEWSADRGPAAEAVAWAVAHLSEREAVFARTDLLAAALAWNPGAAPVADIEREVAAREAAGTLHAARLPGLEDRLTTDRAVADERETIALMGAGQGRGAVPMRGRAVDKALRNGPLTHGQKDAVRLILSADDRVVGVQGYAGSGKTTMLNRARTLLEKKGYAVRGLAPSASAARTLEGEAGIGSETLQRFLMRYSGVAEGRMTKKGAKEMRAAFAKTALVVDEGSLASTVQARNLLRIADALRIPRVVLVGDEKQLDAVDAGKPFAQLQREGMKTAVMDEIMRQRDPELKEAVEASLAGDVRKAFEKLGGNIAEVKPDNLAGAAAARWLALSPEERANTGLMAPSHALREGINEIVRERLVRDGVVHGPAMMGERLVSKGYTNAEKTLSANYAAGDVVAFHRPYKRLGVEKGDELRVAGVDRAARAVRLEGRDGQSVPWKPEKIGARSGGVEVYKREEMELRAGDRIRWTRNDTGLGLVNSQTAEVAAVRGGTVTFRLGDGRMLHLNQGDAQLRHVDRAWASTVHAFQGRTVDTVIAAMEASHPNLTTQKTLYVEISRARDKAELVTDDKAALREQLEAATGERIAALEAVEPEKAKGRDAALDAGRSNGDEGGASVSKEAGRTSGPVVEQDRAPKSLDRDLAL